MLRRDGGEVELSAGDVVIRRGDPGEAVYVLLEGHVEVRLRAADGRHLKLATLGPGQMFGELSLLRGAPASADVRAIGPVRAVRLPAERFATAMAECAALRDHVLADLANRMHETTTDAWGLHKRAEGFTNLARPEVEDGALVAASARMQALKRQLVRWGEAGEHAIIAGEAGTERRLAARLVHKSAGFEVDTQVEFDCREVAPGRIHGALFGISMSNDFREGSGCFGAIHLAHGGSLLLANLGKRVVRADRRPPQWLVRHGELWIPAVGFVAILLVERVFHMTTDPVATAIMLATLILGALLFGVIFEREVWCRHVCPLGRLAVVLAPAAPLSMAADRARCAATCTTHECYKGTDTTEGCPVFHHPLMTSESHHCKLCGDCLTNCPHESTGPYLRPPLKGTWKLGGSGSFPVAFAWVLLLVTPLFLAESRGAVLADPVILTGAAVLALLLGFALAAVARKTLGGGRDLRLRVAAVLAVLAWGPLMADQFANIPSLGTIQLTASGASSGVALLSVLQIAVILGAALLAAIASWWVLVRSAREGRQVGPLVRFGLPAVGTAYTLGALAIVL